MESCAILEPIRYSRYNDSRGVMEKLQIDFLKEKHHLRDSRRSPVLFFGRTLAIIVIIAATAGTVFSYQVDSTSDSTGNFPTISFFSTLKQFVSSDERKLQGEENDRVNLLLMGIGGEGHDGPQLSDTIIFTSYRPSDGSFAMMALPRDMTVPIPGYGYRKVNHANAYGEMNEPGAGPTLASQVIGDVLDEEINYYVRVDFDGFAEFIDAIGGVDVYVDQSFSDYNYPTPGKEYDTCGFVEPATETNTTTPSPKAEVTVQQTPEPTTTVEENTTEQPTEKTVEQTKPQLGPDY